MSELDFSVTAAELGENAFVVTVSGEADIYTAPALEQAIEGVVGLGATSVVLDFAEVSFMDSSVLSVLVRQHENLKRLGGKLVIVSDDHWLRRTFEITGFDRILTIEQKLAEGIAVVQPSR